MQIADDLWIHPARIAGYPVNTRPSPTHADQRPTRLPLCFPERENVLWQDASCRVIRVDDPIIPATAA